MDTKDHMKWVGRKFLFAVMTHTPPGQSTKEITPIKISGMITSVTCDERTGTVYIEVNTKQVYLHNRVYSIVKQVITIEKGKRPYLYFDSCKVTGYECFAGDFLFLE